MPDFAYQAVDVAGRRVRGREEAPSPLALTRELEARGLIVIDVGEAPAERDSGIRFGQRQQVLELTRAVAALLKAGLPLPPPRARDRPVVSAARPPAQR